MMIVDRIAQALAAMRYPEGATAGADWRALRGEAVAILDTLAACPAAERLIDAAEPRRHNGRAAND
ncbi:hypothetical protein GCM10009087_33270 [Sphingomonas oligophenolica]|uniref:Uracil-DNA glycosylase n=1 Tax=Sphingomonas oligophenolica TaxID=301154 RepID=A0ABU9XYK6_9SPHN